MSVKWKDKCETFGNSIIESIKLNENKYDDELFRYFDLDEKLDFLDSFIDFPKGITSIDKRDILSEFLNEFTSTRPINTKDFLANISQKVSNYLKKKDKPYVVYSSISIPFTKNLKTTQIDGVKIKFSEKLNPKYDRKKHYEIMSIIGNEQEQFFYSFVEVFVEAKTVDAAYNKAFDALDLLRGIWALHKTPIDFFPNNISKRAINIFTLGPYHTVHSIDGKLENTKWLWFEKNFVFSPTPKISTFITELQIVEKKINRKIREHKYPTELKDFIRRYARAIDHADKHHCFLELWGLLEILTGTGGNNYETTIARAVSIHPDWEYWKVKLNHLRVYRNESVHTGLKSNRIESYLTYLIYPIMKLIKYHLYNVNRFNKTESFDFLNITTNTEELIKQLKLRNKALKYRSK